VGSGAVFVLLTFAASWLVWLVTIGGPFYLLGVYAPAFVALALTAYSGGRAAVSALLHRMAIVSVPARWYLFAVGYFAAIKIGVALLHRVALGTWPAFAPEPWFLMLAGVAISTPFQAGEEIGWRGYLLPRLTMRVGLPVASLIVGVVWACWHLPLFFVAGADTSGQPFAPYLLSVTALSVAMAWLYWRTDGSLLLTMLMHAAVNNLNLVPAPRATATHVFALSASFVAWATAALLWAGAAGFLIAMRLDRRRGEPRPGAPNALP